MKSKLLILAMAISLNIVAQENPIDIRFYKNIELCGYIIELGDPSDNDPDHPISIEINKWPEDKTNPTLYKIFELAGDMDYGSIISLFYSLPDLTLQNNNEIPLEILKNYITGTAEEIEKIRKLVNLSIKFSQESHFEKVWTNLAPFRAETLNTIAKMKPSESLIYQMEKFYESDFSSYEIVPSLTIWSGSGWGFKNKQKNTASFILGPLGKNYVFDESRFTNLAIHEFGHSYVNHVVIQHEDIVSRTANLFESIKADMLPQGYRNWETCLIEHFVRAGEIIIPELSGNSSESKDLIKDYTENRKFIYIAFIIKKLRYYRLGKKYSYQDAVQRTLLDFEKKYN